MVVTYLVEAEAEEAANIQSISVGVIFDAAFLGMIATAAPLPLAKLLGI